MLKQGTIVDIVVEKCLLTHKREKTSGKNHWVRTWDARGIVPSNQVTTPSWVLKRRRLINGQVIGKILYISMSISSRREHWMGIKHLWNARDGALIFCSYGLRNRLGGSGASRLAALGVGWEEQHLHSCFPSVGPRFLLYILML